MPVPPVVLSIAGFDPSSGAGITADIKTAAALGCYAVTCPTALTVQSTQGVFGVEQLRPELISRILERLTDDFEIRGVKIGMLGSGKAAAAVSRFLGTWKSPNVVLDPILRSSSGATLVDDSGLAALRAMLPLCTVTTPNLAEAAALAGAEPMPEEAPWESALPELRRMAGELHRLGAKAVVITGGHLRPANDYLSWEEPGRSQEQVFVGEHIDSRSTHGTGCAFAMAIACRLALGDGLPQATEAAKQFVRRAILSAHPLGKGIGPVV